MMWIGRHRGHLSLGVLQTLPDGFTEHPLLFIGSSDLREASRYNDGHLEFYHWCSHCKGWIAGTYEEHEVCDWHPSRLAGRMGTVYACRRCGRELFFTGVQS